MERKFVAQDAMRSFNEVQPQVPNNSDVEFGRSRGRAQDKPKDSRRDSKPKPVDHFFKITQRYRTLYSQSWADRSTKVKTAALERAIYEKCTMIYTREVFLQEFARRVDLLLDSKHFCAAVKGLVPPLKPYDVATHIVVLGWEEVERVLLHGGYKLLQPFEEWKTPILEYKVLRPYLEYAEEEAQQEPAPDVENPAEEAQQN